MPIGSTTQTLWNIGLLGQSNWQLGGFPAYRFDSFWTLQRAGISKWCSSKRSFIWCCCPSAWQKSFTRGAVGHLAKSKSGAGIVCLLSWHWLLDWRSSFVRVQGICHSLCLQSTIAGPRVVLLFLCSCWMIQWRTRATRAMEPCLLLCRKLPSEDVFESRIEQLDYWRGCDTDGNCRIQKAGSQRVQWGPGLRPQ